MLADVTCFPSPSWKTRGRSAVVRTERSSLHHEPTI